MTYYMYQPLSFPLLKCLNQQIKAQCRSHMLTSRRYINKVPSYHKLHESCINHQDQVLERIFRNCSKPRKNNLQNDDTLHKEEIQHINYFHHNTFSQRHIYLRIVLVYSHNLDIESLAMHLA